jgi:hypothetical protein
MNATASKPPRPSQGNDLNRDMAAAARALEKLAVTSEKNGCEPLAREARVISDSFSTRIKALDLLKKYAVRNG